MITENTNIDFIPELHYVLIDMDFPIAQWNGYNLVKNKIVRGGYLCLHDMIPKGHIHGCHERYQQILKENMFKIILEDIPSYLVILEKL